MPSLGAVAVLIYASEASPLSQPYNVIVGNMLAALVGIIISEIFGYTFQWIRAALSVSITIMIMQITKSVHPPAGATALFAATGDHEQGWLFLVLPVLPAVITMVLISMFTMNWKGNKSYPKFWLPEPPFWKKCHPTI